VTVGAAVLVGIDRSGCIIGPAAAGAVTPERIPRAISPDLTVEEKSEFIALSKSYRPHAHPRNGPNVDVCI
jgi:hypothetical protein